MHLTVTDVCLFGGSLALLGVMIVTDTISIFALAALAIALVVTLAGHVPVLDYEGPEPLTLVAFFVAIGAVVVL